MTKQKLVWTDEVRNEFYKFSLDNYNLFDSVEDATTAFIFDKLQTNEYRRKKQTEFIKPFWEFRNN